MPFAENYPKNDEGHIIFPDDRQLRQKLFDRVYHPAHNNLTMLKELVEYLAESGQIVCDPMAGAGSIMYTAQCGVTVWCIELGPYFSEMLEMNKKNFEGRIIIIPETDCEEFLNRIPQGSFHHIIFSPPYAEQLQTNKGTAIFDQDEGNTSAGRAIKEYTYDHRANLGNMDNFTFNQAMVRVYKAMYRSLKPNGTMTIIIKDRINKGQLVGIPTFHMQTSIRSGFKSRELYKREAIGAVFGRHNLARGYRQVTWEDIIIMEKRL